MRAILLASLLLAGCGYTMGQDAGDERKTVAVPVFLNETLRRDLERDFTRFVREEIRSRTRYTLVDESASPDFVISGKLIDLQEQVLSEVEGGGIRESSVVFTVTVTVTAKDSEEPMVDNVQYIERQAFTGIKGESIRTAETTAMRTLAERIVYGLSSRW